MRWLAVLLLLCGCMHRGGDNRIVKLNIIDRNGMNETIQAEERLARYQGVDFTRPQPYEKVLRVYGAREDGAVPSYVTSYHDNGQIAQYLEVVDGRAWGLYQEWYPNGQVKLEAQVTGGTADITEGAKRGYLFEGVTRAWSEEGGLLAEIAYARGALDGESKYYFGDGRLQRLVHYKRGQREGLSQEFYVDGRLAEEVTYRGGVPSGLAMGYWPAGEAAYEEYFEDGLLVSGWYENESGVRLAAVLRGSGTRVVFLDDGGREEVAICDGEPAGAVWEYDGRGDLVRSYSLQGGAKEGEEIEYWPQGPFAKAGAKPVAKLSVNWHRGEIQGLVKTWYRSGQLESQREMSRNQKNGVCMAWYEDGSLMFIEEYRSDQLVKGEYYPSESAYPISRIKEGEGLATLYDPKGNFLRRVTYIDGAPCE